MHKTWPVAGLMRGCCGLLAAPLALLLLVHPAAFVSSTGHYPHSLLMLVMLGISSGIVCAVGFRPYGWLWRAVFSPWLAVPLMLLGYGVLVHAQGWF